jgi:hypothetical protein
LVTTDAPFTHKRAAIPGITAQLPNGGTIQSTHTCSLALPFLPAAARDAHIFLFLASGSLNSIGLLCDHGCTALFNARTVTIKYKDCIVLSPITKLWNLDVPRIVSAPPSSNADTPRVASTTSTANAVINNPNLAERIAFTTPSCFYPRFLLGAQPSTLAFSPVGQNSRQPKFAETHHSLLPWSKGTSTKNAPMFDPQN